MSVFLSDLSPDRELLTVQLMKYLEEIRKQLQAGGFEFTRHAFKQAIERNISERELREIADKLEIIEDYPDDKYSPSCLILGFTTAKRALHLQVSLLESDTLRIITLYEPDETIWINYRTRRS